MSLAITIGAGIIAHRLTFGSFRGMLIPLLMLGLASLFINTALSILTVFLVSGVIAYFIATLFLKASEKTAMKFAAFSFGFALILPYVLNSKIIADLFFSVGIASVLGVLI